MMYDPCTRFTAIQVLIETMMDAEANEWSRSFPSIFPLLLQSCVRTCHSRRLICQGKATAFEHPGYNCVSLSSIQVAIDLLRYPPRNLCPKIFGVLPSISPTFLHTSETVLGPCSLHPLSVFHFFIYPLSWGSSVMGILS